MLNLNRTKIPFKIEYILNNSCEYECATLGKIVNWKYDQKTKLVKGDSLKNHAKTQIEIITIVVVDPSMHRPL